ncbi:MAG: QueT transporter family protein [Ruminococcaceae bacterium]|nr:QueT transporter family protein [Oscillospiraceae bacterium]
MKQTRTRIRMMTYGALIAALYVALTYLAALLGLSGGVIQIRFSEALTVLPAIVPALYAPGTVIGLFIGCILANTLTGALIWDIIFGSFATLLGAIGTLLLRRIPRVGTALAWLPPTVANTLIVPFVLQKAYGVQDAIWFLMLTIGIGELLSCGVLGSILIRFAGPKLRSMKNDC